MARQSYNINQTFIDRDAKPKGTQTDYFDSKIKGFGVRVSAAGKKTWFYMYRDEDGKQRRYSFGTYPALPVGEARDQAKIIDTRVDKGEDPSGKKRNLSKSPTFKEIAQQYLERYAKPNKRSWEEDKRMLEKDAYPAWEKKKAHEIKRRDVIALIDKVSKRGPISANRTLAVIRRVFNWAVSRDLLDSSPCVQVEAVGKEKERDRVLSLEEIKAIWNAFEVEGRNLENYFKLRLVTAQRGAEVSAIRWSDINEAEKVWTIPAEVAKNKLSHRVPLTDLALTILAAQKDRLEKSKTYSKSLFAFPSHRDITKPVQSIHKATERFNTSEEIKTKVDDFVPHDLRRTAASHMASLGIPRLVISKVLNHVERGVTRVYDRHGYDQEKRWALEVWENRLKEVLEL